MKLSTLSILLGLVFILPNLYGLLKPAQFGQALRRFPRSETWGYLLVGLATGWFIYNVKKEPIADFEPLKPFLYALFLFVGIGACIFVKDFLAVRGLAVVLLLLAKLMVDTARWAESDWSLVLVTLAYIWIIAGMWLTISPWRLRDLLHWKTENEGRIRLFSGIRVGIGLLITVLGLTVFRLPH